MIICLKMKYIPGQGHKEVGLNDYEKFYFKKHFGTNLKRLYAFRKAISKDQSQGFYRSECYTYRAFMLKGGKYHSIMLNRKKVDAYIKLIQNEDNT